MTRREELTGLRERDEDWLAQWREFALVKEESMTEALKSVLARVHELHEEKEGLSEQLKQAVASQNELAQARATLKRLEEECTRVIGERDKTERERDELSVKVAEMKDTMESVLRSVEGLFDTERSERFKVEELNRTVEAVTQERDALQASMASQSSINKALHAQSSLMEQKQRSMKHQWSSEVSQLRKAKDELSKRLGAAVAEEKRLRALLMEKEANLQSSSQCIQQMTLELHTLQAVIASNDDAIDELEACEVVSNDDMSMLRTLIIRQKHDLMKSEKEMKEMKVLNEELMKNVEGKERELSQMECELNEKRESFEKKVSKVKKENEGLKRQNEGLKKENEELKSEVEKAKKETEQTRKEAEEAKQRTEQAKQEAEQAKQELDKRTTLQGNEAFGNPLLSSVENDTPSTMSESVLQEGRDTVATLREENARLQNEFAESQDRIARLQQTIRSKYAEYKEMKDTVTEARELAARLGNDFDKLKKKYATAKSRIAHLEKSKLSTTEMEKIKQLLKTKEAMREECQGLRFESKQLQEQVDSMKEEMTSWGLGVRVRCRDKERVERVHADSAREGSEDRRAAVGFEGGAELDEFCVWKPVPGERERDAEHEGERAAAAAC